MLAVFVLEVCERGQHRVRRSLTETAQGGILDHLGEGAQLLDVAGFAVALRDPGEDVEHTGRALAARGALAARLVADEVHEKLRDGHHARILVHDDEAAGTDDRAGLLERIKVHGQIHVRLRQAAAGRAADLHGLECFAVFDAAADLIHDLAHRRAHGHLDQAGVDDVARQGEGLRAGAALRADGLEPVGALLDDVGDVGKRLDVVQAGGLAVQALVDGTRGLRARHAAVALDGRGHGRALAADERACAAVDVHMEAEAAAEDVVAQQAELLGLLDGDGEPVHGHGVLGADIDVALGRARGNARDDHALDDLVRVALHAGAVHEGAGVALVAVADDVLHGLFGVRRDLRPLFARREARAAAAAQTGIAHDLHDLVRLHLEQRLGQRAVAADGQILLDGFRVDVAAVLKHAAGLTLVKRDILLPLIELAAPIVAEALDELPAEDGLLNDLLHVADLALGVQPALGLDAHQRSHLAKAVAAGLFQADGVVVVLGQGDLAGDAELIHALFELMIDVQVAAGDTARAAADKDLPLFRLACGHVLGLQRAELLQGFDSLTHYAPSFARSSSIRSAAFSGVMDGWTVSLTITTGLRPHAPRHETISIVNRPSSEVGLLSLRPVASYSACRTLPDLRTWHAVPRAGRG